MSHWRMEKCLKNKNNLLLNYIFLLFLEERNGIKSTDFQKNVHYWEIH